MLATQKFYLIDKILNDLKHTLNNKGNFKKFHLKWKRQNVKISLYFRSSWYRTHKNYILLE